MRGPGNLLSINNHMILLPSSIWWGVALCRWCLTRTWKLAVILLLFPEFDLAVYSYPFCCLPSSTTLVSYAGIVPATCQINFTIFDPITGINWNLGTTADFKRQSLSCISCGGPKYSTLCLSPHKMFISHDVNNAVWCNTSDYKLDPLVFRLIRKIANSDF
jgi:hypothetical protein